MQEFAFEVQGSAPSPYRVRFVSEAGQLFGTCTCPAGEIGQMCKHRSSILAGDVTAVVAGADGVPAVLRLLSGTALEAAIQAVAVAESEVARAKSGLAAAKKQLGRVIGTGLNP